MVRPPLPNANRHRGKNLKRAGALGVLAGQGRLPTDVAAGAAAAGRPVHIVGIRGEAAAEITHYDHTWIAWGQIGRMMKAFRDADCTELVIIGAVSRPNLSEARLDWGAIASLPSILSLTVGGDDALLSRVVRFFEARGFGVIGAHEIAPDLLAGDGPLGTHAPTEQHLSDIARGRTVVDTMGRLDIGQAVVVAKGYVLAVEAAEGTDRMIDRAKELRQWGRKASAPRVGVLVKMPKPGQELRVDMPTIGVETVRRAADAGLAGIAVAEGRVLIADKAATIAAADAAGLFLVGITPEPTRQSSPPDDVNSAADVERTTDSPPSSDRV